MLSGTTRLEQFGKLETETEGRHSDTRNEAREASRASCQGARILERRYEMKDGSPENTRGVATSNFNVSDVEAPANRLRGQPQAIALKAGPRDGGQGNMEMRRK